MNILFYLGMTLDPEHGGIHRVTDVLMHGLSTSHQVYCLMQRKTRQTLLSSHFFHVPNQQDILGEENRNYIKKLCADLSIQVVINQEGITPYLTAFILTTIPVHIQVISVIHTSLTLIYGAKSRIPLSIKHYIPNKILDVTDTLALRYFRHKYKTQYRILLERSDKVVVLDESLKTDAMKFLNVKIPSTQICAIQNPISFPMTEYISTDQKQRTVLYVGRLSKEKGLDLLLNIWKQVESNHPEWQLVIVGEGTKRAQIEKNIQKFKLRHVSLTGKQNPTPYYQVASIFLMTSLFEGFPLVLLEAMNYSIVPLAFGSFSSVHTIIEDEKTGYIIFPFQIRQYANVLSNVMDNHELRKKLARNAYEKSKEFSLETILAKWEKLFESLQYKN